MYIMILYPFTDFHAYIYKYFTSNTVNPAKKE